MTLIVSLEGKDGLVLTADSRGTIGDPRGLTAINDIQQKLFKINSHCGIGTAGSSELASRLIDTLLKKLQNKSTDVDVAINEMYNHYKTEYTNWFGVKPWHGTGQIIDHRPVVSFIVAGYNSTKKPRIYLLNSQLDFVPQLCENGSMLLGVPQYAIYLCHRLYNRQMSVKNLKSLAAYLISETASQDPKVGGPIRIAEITPEKGYVDVPENEIQEIIKRNEDQNLKLRQFFFPEG